MKPQTPQRPTSSALSPAAILASIRANSITPSANMSRARSVPRGLIQKFEPIPPEPRKFQIETSFIPSKESINEKTNPDETSELSIEAPKLASHDIKKGILVKRREKLNSLSNVSFSKASAEELRRASVLRLFTDPCETSLNKDDKEIKTLHSIKESHELPEGVRGNPTSLPGYGDSIETKKNSRKVTFAFNEETRNVHHERLGSSLANRPHRLNRAIKNTFDNERIANMVSRNRAFRLIAENVKPGPRIISEGFTLSYDSSPVTKAREIKQVSKERDHMKIGLGTPANNMITAELTVTLDSKDNDLSIKKSSSQQLPPVMKMSTELLNILSAEKSPSKKEENIYNEIGRKSLVNSSSAASLGNYKTSGSPYSYNVNRLRKKDSFSSFSSLSGLNDSKLKTSFQNTSINTSMNKGFKIDYEQGMIDAREEYKKKLFSLLKKQRVSEVVIGCK